RRHRRRERTAPPPPAPAADPVAAAGSLVRVLRGQGVHLVGRRSLAWGPGPRLRAGRRRGSPGFPGASAAGSLPCGGLFQPLGGLGSVEDLPTREGMALRLRAHLPRVALLVLLGLAATAVVSYAAGQRAGSTPPATSTTAAVPPLVVPDVRNQAFVFAKSALEDAGFAWHVLGSV